MARKSDVYEVLIASPGDVVSERTVINEVVEDWNAAHAKDSGRMLQTRRWELDARPELGDRPQAIINKQFVDDADILVAVFSARLGSPTGVSPSGTVEEIERLRSVGKPVLVYFSTAPLPRDHDPAQLRLLSEYKRELSEKGLFCQFGSDDELRRMASRHLATVMSGQKPVAVIAKPDMAKVSLQFSQRGKIGEVRIITASVLLENLSPVKRITEYMVTLSVPRSCLTHSSASYIRQIRSPGSERCLFRTTEADENIIMPGDKAKLFSIDLGVDQLRMKGTHLAGDIEAALADKVVVEAVVDGKRYSEEKLVAEIFSGLI
jgi:hypothetical protein